MNRLLWSVHLHPRDRDGQGFRIVEDRFRPLALALPPVWALVEGLWVTAAAMITLLAALLVLVGPAQALVAWYGATAITALEGASLIRLELRLRGWREAGLVEAATREGADECWLTGQAVRTANP